MPEGDNTTPVVASVVTVPNTVNDLPVAGTSSSPGQMPNSTVVTPQQPLDTETVDFKDLPESWKAHVKSLRDENKSYRQADETRSTEKKQADEQKQKEQGEWQKLADEREGEVNRLKPYEAQAKELNTLLLTRMKAEVEKWPDEVKATMPKGDSVTAPQFSEWLDSHKPLAEKILGASPSRAAAPRGNTSGPTPAAPGNRPASSNDQPLVNFRL